MRVFCASKFYGKGEDVVAKSVNVVAGMFFSNFMITKNLKMARQIKETPVLKGREAAKFLADINKSKDQKASKEALEKIRKNYERLQAISTF